MNENKQRNPLTLLLVAVLAAILALLLWLFTATVAYTTPDVLYVAPGGDCGSASPCYNSVQDAVDAAQPVDEIRVAAGTYFGINNLGGLAQVVYIDKSLTIQGGYTTSNWNNPDPDANPTEINALAQGRAMVISGTVNVTVDGLILSYGNAAGLGGHTYLFQTSDAGGGLYISQSNVTLTNISVMTSTVSDGAGGGVYIGNGVLTMQNSTLQGSYGKNGGGAYFYNSVVNLEGNIIQNNNGDTTFGEGGGLNINGGTVSLTSNTIQNNTGGPGGGVSASGDLSLWMVGNSINNNVASNGSGGGAKLSMVSFAYVVGNTILANSANGTIGSGGGIAIAYSDVTLAGNTVENNSSLDNGGGIHLQGDATIISNLIRDNHTTSGVGGGGAGVSMIYCGSETVFASNIIRGNVADNFGSIGPGKGGGVALSYCDSMSLTGNLIASNEAHNGDDTHLAAGGGLSLYRSDVIMENNFIVDNLSEGIGSGIYVVGSSPTLYHTTIANNTGGDGSGIYATFEDLFDDPSIVVLYNSIIVSQTIGVKVSNDSPQNLATLDGVLWWANGTNKTGTTFLFNETTGNPDFVDPASYDYHITANSAAIDKGIDVGVLSDYDDEPRSGVPDLGADEYWGPSGFRLIYLPLVVKD